MSLLVLFNRRGNTRKSIGFLNVDVFSEEEITLDNEVTDNPIESGEAVTDHVYNRPVVLRVRGNISNATSGFSLAGFGLSGDRRQDGYEKLRQLHRDKELIDVVTGLESFSSMVIKNLTIPRDITNSGGLTFTAEFWQVRFIDSRRVELAAADDVIDAAAQTQEVGRQNPDAASPEDAARAESLLIRLGRLGGLIQ